MLLRKPALPSLLFTSNMHKLFTLNPYKPYIHSFIFYCFIPLRVTGVLEPVPAVLGDSRGVQSALRAEKRPKSFLLEKTRDHTPFHDELWQKTDSLPCHWMSLFHFQFSDTTFESRGDLNRTYRSLVQRRSHYSPIEGMTESPACCQGGEIAA